jgi:hypothetical protein
MKTHSSPFRSERGSLLIVAMIMSAVIAISIASYIRLGVQSQKMSNRAFYNNGAMNLAERGMEEAMYSVNKMVNDATYDWSGWTKVNSNADAEQKWTGYTFDQNATGLVRVYVEHYDGTLAPTIIARSTITLGGASSAPIEKWIKVKLAMTSKFSNGLVAKQNIKFSGNGASVDSWNSDPDNDGGATTPAIKYSSTTKDDNGSVGSIAVTAGVSVNNADIWGYVATGGAAATIGPNGIVGPFGTTSGIATGHSSTDFAASFDTVSSPTSITIAGVTTPITYTPVGTINNDTVLPGSAPVAADGKYYIQASGITKGVTTVTAGKEVVLKVTGAISLQGGGDGITLASTTSKLAIYTSDDVNITGNGVLNGGGDVTTMGQPINFQIWGTATSGSQTFKVSGNGIFSGVIYAPFADVELKGNAAVAGSVVANTIDVSGSNVAFHYDESLGNFGGNPFRVAAWTELTTAADRAAYSSQLSF